MSRSKLRIVFFGTADFAVPSLEALISAGYAVVTVVTQPDKAQGRGRRTASGPVKLCAEHHQIPLLQLKAIRTESFLRKLRDLNPDLFVTAAYGRIMPQALLDVPAVAPLNVHGSLLPKYRGAAPIQRAIMAGEMESGVTLMWMDAGMDTGDILLREALPITDQDTTGTLTDKLAQLGATMLLEAVAAAHAGKPLVRTPQTEDDACAAPPITAEDGVIDWNETALQIDRRVRALSPRPGAACMISGKRIKVWAAEPMHTTPGEATQQPAPGTVLSIKKAPPGVLVQAGSNTALLLTDVQAENSRRMSAADWARGVHLAVGSRFESGSASS